MRAIKYFEKKKKFNKIAKDIQTIKIQGAKNVAKKALEAYLLFPSKKSKKKLISLRPTEPMLVKVLNEVEKTSKKEVLEHFSFSQEKINKEVFKLIKDKDIIFTHCHSSSVTASLIYSKNKKKKFEVYNTETRPLFQGRKTSRELSKAKIKVTQFVDSAMKIALTKTQGTKKVKKIFLGADAILEKGVINKVGSGMLSEIAEENKIPLYIITDSWKYSKKSIEMEERNFKEIWEKLSKNYKIKIRNPAFEFVPKENIKGIISEFGTLSYDKFLEKMKK
ncbi:hypothetical protein HOD88_02810 [archaeon]|jgi:ribose 1,5-bisphosphate isomerase|nr:hypothetical protein [archaeon]